VCYIDELADAPVFDFHLAPSLSFRFKPRSVPAHNNTQDNPRSRNLPLFLLVSSRSATVGTDIYATTIVVFVSMRTFVTTGGVSFLLAIAPVAGAPVCGRAAFLAQLEPGAVCAVTLAALFHCAISLSGQVSR